jgi:hypothetical protein
MWKPRHLTTLWSWHSFTFTFICDFFSRYFTLIVVIGRPLSSVVLLPFFFLVIPSVSTPCLRFVESIRSCKQHSRGDMCSGEHRVRNPSFTKWRCAQSCAVIAFTHARDRVVFRCVSQRTYLGRGCIVFKYTSVFMSHFLVQEASQASSHCGWPTHESGLDFLQVEQSLVFTMPGSGIRSFIVAFTRSRNGFLFPASSFLFTPSILLEYYHVLGDVTVDGVQMGHWTRNYALQITDTHKLVTTIYNSLY